MLEGTLVFDLETQCLAEEVGGWTNIHRLGFAAGALLHVETQQMRFFLEKDVSDLIQHLERARIIIGFNLMNRSFSPTVDQEDEAFRKPGSSRFNPYQSR